MHIPSQKRQAIERLQSYIDAFALSPYCLKSRVHSLRTLSAGDIQVYLKRDDELSFGISGSKLRKYSSLIPYLLKKRVKKAVLIGGAYSNNILGISQLLIENGIRPILFLRKPGNGQVQGNYLFTRLLVPEEDVILVDRDQWDYIEEIAESYAGGGDAFIVPEGAFLEESLYGAFSLPLDIMRNERELGIEFDHIFVDAGTGLQAIALIKGLAFCGSGAKVHVLLLAQTKIEFENRFRQLSSFPSLLEKEINSNYSLHYPSVSASFGSVTAKGFRFIHDFARTEGVLLDPVYSGKMVFESKRILNAEGVKGKALLIHSGGGLALSGFQAPLRYSFAIPS